MSTFDAGAIESRLTLDRSDFSQGIKQARREAKDLDGTEIDILVNLKNLEELRELETRLDAIQDEQVNVEPEIDDVRARMQMVDLIRDLEAMASAASPTINVDVDGDLMAMARLQALEAQAEAMDNDIINMRVVTTGNDGKELGSQNMGQKYLDGWRILIYLLIALMPVLTSAVGAAAGAVAGLSGILVAGGAAGGVFALGLAAAILQMGTLQEMGEAAPKWFLEFQRSLDAAGEAWYQFQDAVSPAAFGVMESGLDAIITLLPQLVPVFNAVADVTDRLLQNLNAYFQSDDWLESLDYIGNFGSFAFGKILETAGNLLDFLLELGIAFQPLSDSMVRGLERITEGWATWAEEIQNTDGLRDFMDWVQERGGQVIDLLLAIGEAFIHIGIALDPIAEPVLLGLTAFFEGIANMDTGVLTVIAGGFIAIFTGLKLGVPLLTAIANGGGIWAMLGLGAAAGPIAAGIAGVVGVLGGLLGYLVLTTDTGGPFRDMWESIGNLWDTIVETGQSIWQIIQDLYVLLQQTGIIENFQMGLGLLADNLAMLLPILEPIAIVIGGTLIGALYALSTAFLATQTAVNAFIEFIEPAITAVVDFFNWMYMEIVGNSIVPDMINEVIAWFQRLPGALLGILLNMGGQILGFFARLALNSINTFARMGDGILRWIGNTTGRAQARWNQFVGWFGGLAGRFAGQVARWFSNLPGRVGEMAGRAKGRFNEFLGWLGGLGGRIAGQTANIFNGIYRNFAAVINRIIARWNNLSFSIPSIDLPGPLPSIPGATISTPNVPYLASGGLVKSATLAMVGEGREQEAVLPLSELWAMAEREREFAMRNGGDAGQSSSEKALDARLTLAIETLIEEIRSQPNGPLIENYNDYGQRSDARGTAEDIWILSKERG